MTLEARNKTLGELLAELRSRLGFMSVGSGAQANAGILTSLLQEAHDFVYGELDPPTRRMRWVLPLLPGESLYDFNDDANSLPVVPENIGKVWLTSEGAQATELHQGIDEGMRTQPPGPTPERYDSLNGQLEVCPTPSVAATLVIEHIAGKARFTQPGDRPSVPDRLVFLYALASAKAHFRQPDSQASMAAFSKMLSKQKFKQKENRRHFAAAMSEQGSIGQVVKSGNGYSLKV